MSSLLDLAKPKATELSRLLGDVSNPDRDLSTSLEVWHPGLED